MILINRFLVLTLLSCAFSFSQKNQKAHIMIDREQYEDLFCFEKKGNGFLARLRILYYNDREKGFERDAKIKKTHIKDEEIVLVSEQPSTDYYEFIAYEEPRKVENIEDIETSLTIEDISKNEFKGMEFPYSFVFIESIKSSEFNLWEMFLIFEE